MSNSTVTPAPPLHPLKVLSIVGTRPEAIKLAPVICELRLDPTRILSRVCSTAQHREMLDPVLDLFSIVPDDDLNVMRANQSPAQVAAAVLTALEPVLQRERPDWVIVQGDTVTTMAAALAAFYQGVKVAHVEAGLRTFDKRHPFPEELNRCVTSIAADVHFAPTAGARDNLLRAGILETAIVVTGNPVIDALREIAALPYDPTTGPLKTVPWERKLILVTAHRRENLGAPLEAICLALQDLARFYAGDLYLVCPVHLNPTVQTTFYRLLHDVPGIILTPPLDYRALIYLLERVRLVLTDSGGLQEEAAGLGKPVLVLREVTERPEGVRAGVARLVGTNRERIVQTVRHLLDDPNDYHAMAIPLDLYGDGQAAPRIVNALLTRG